METTFIIGRIMAPYLIVTGLGFFLSKSFYKKSIEEAEKSDPVLINLSGMVHFLIGMTILTLHFRRNNLLETMISILGFLFTLKGAFIIALPVLTLKSNEASIKLLRVMGTGFTTAGLIIGYLSYLG
ncbi:hypothetical protein [Xanthovirga aplysinae]|uniref:hypothetical protein n=1 Tax=Xanthovirga aplysinae TaxID=2529853 RepID=UPI0012BC3284|nr:hypothetical protein [Xanthovirga aplysinae]MTI33259.1 hypothetical protein [Xanthovirga aplysinae]